MSDALLLEDGSFLLLEDGISHLLLEDGAPIGPPLLTVANTLYVPTVTGGAGGPAYNVVKRGGPHWRSFARTLMLGLT